MIIHENVPLSELTTMRLGGPARFVIDIEDESKIPTAYAFAKEHDLPTFILGGGANTIAKDEGFPGVILRYVNTGISEQPNSVDLRPYAANEERSEQSEPRNDGTTKQEKLELARVSEQGSSVSPDGRERARRKSTELGCYTLTAQAGEAWDNVVAYACERGLTGIEALSKIPGLSGAAPVQNIGAYGQDISQVLDHATAYDTKTHQFTTLTREDLHFTYRKSILNTTAKGRYFITSITLALSKGQIPGPFYNSIETYIESHHITDFTPQSIRQIVSQIRADKLPDPATTPSAGSFFKNIYLTEAEAKQAEAKDIPVYHGHDGLKINSGWLIEKAGLKGKLLHGIRVNDKAALVLINESATSYQDLEKARTEIINTVKSKFGYTLEQEPVEL